MAKYSIVLPVRNGGNYVKLCVNSIFSQTYSDFNFIVLDNCSTDGTLEWLRTLQDKRLKIITSNFPLSIEENWGRIKDIQKNEFLTLIGHDDILYPNFLENIDQLIERYPLASIYHTHFYFIDANGNTIRKCKSMNPLLSFYELLKCFLTQQIDSMGTGYVMRTKDYDALGGIPVKYPNLLFADFELWLKITAIGNLAISQNSCFAFRIHLSTTGKSQDIKLHQAFGLYIEYLVKLKNSDIVAGKILSDYGGQLLYFYCKGFCHRLLRTAKKDRAGISVTSFIGETREYAKQLNIENQYHPERNLSILFAKFIDSSHILRTLFILFKKIFPKPILH